MRRIEQVCDAAEVAWTTGTEVLGAGLTFALQLVAVLVACVCLAGSLVYGPFVVLLLPFGLVAMLPALTVLTLGVVLPAAASAALVAGVASFLKGPFQPWNSTRPAPVRAQRRPAAPRSATSPASGNRARPAPLPVAPTARCPTCGTGFDTAPVHCARCETPHHADCWTYGSRCAIYACGGLEATGASPCGRLD